GAAAGGRGAGAAGGVVPAGARAVRAPRALRGAAVRAARLRRRGAARHRRLLLADPPGGPAAPAALPREPGAGGAAAAAALPAAQRALAVGRPALPHRARRGGLGGGARGQP